MIFQKEKWSEVVTEATPLFHEHYKEIAHFVDIPLEPDWERYQRIEDLGLLHIWTARDESGVLQGYSLYHVTPSLHSRQSLQAQQDIVYIRPAVRGQGVGAKLMRHCDVELKGMNVEVVFTAVKARHNFGPHLERNGYALVDLIYAKRLNGS